MSHEAMKLALEALECKDGWGSSVRMLKEKAVTSLRTSLSASKIEGNLMQRFYGGEEAKSLISEAEETITALRQALANEALDKMAENARELGLDYEPAQQEPVAWMFTDKEGTELFEQREDWEGRWTPLYTSPPAQRTWVGLTDEEREIASWTDGSFGAGARWADAKLKEKNT